MYMDTRYYVYVYLDPRKPGLYVFGELKFDYEPIYIGKGCRFRIIHHLKKRLVKKSLFYSKLNRIINAGFEPIFYKVFDGLSEPDALMKEVELIKLIGRIEMETGTLCNMSDGGEIGFVRSEEARKNISESKKGEKNPMFGKKQNENQKRAAIENGIKAKERSKGKKWSEIYDEETIQRMLDGCANRKPNEKTRTDSKNYKLTDINGNEYIISGMVNLQAFCSEKEIQFQLLRKKIDADVITETDLKSNKTFAKNTLGWKIEKII